MKTKRLFSWAVALVALIAGTISHAGPSDLDKTFNAKGYRLDFPGAYFFPGVAVDSHGRIVVGGTFPHTSGDFDFALIRYKANGELDTTFGTGGMLLIDFYTEGGFGSGRRDDFAVAMAMDGDDNVYLAGSYEFSATDTDTAVMKISPTGTMLAAARPLGSGADAEWFSAIALDSAGRVCLGGDINGNSIFVLRLTSSLGADSTFNGGAAQMGLAGKQATGIGVDSSDRVLVTYWKLGDESAVARLTAAGDQPDPGFGTNGITDIVSDRPTTESIGLVVDGSDRAVVAGTRTSGDDKKLFVTRLKADGTADTDFGTGGMSYTDFGTLKEAAFGLAMHEDGKIVVVGEAKDDATAYDVLVVRYLADGKPDTTHFNPPDGGITKDFAGGGDVLDLGAGVTVAPDGKIVVAGLGGAPDLRVLVARFLGDFVPARPADTWSQYRSLAITTFQYYAYYGLWDYAYGVYYYYTALGDLEFYNAYKDPATASYLYNLNLGYTYYYLYGQSNVGLYYLYLFWGYGYYYYFLSIGDFTNASAYFNALYGAALSVL